MLPLSPCPQQQQQQHDDYGRSITGDRQTVAFKPEQPTTTMLLMMMMMMLLLLLW
jgi:hypothetical protein